ncbi:MAG TPA: YdcF family protein [candidate division Zixibacteria bacterium]|nr:YdcF family protein [candidate division Zixibacteria bacterium]
MFVAKQFLKSLIMPPVPWLLLLLAVLILWRRRWARTLLGLVLCLIVLLHSAPFGYLLRHPLESRYRPLLDPRRAEPYQAIVVLTGGILPAEGLIPFPTLEESMFRRLDEAWRLYRISPKPVIVSGGHVNPFTAPKNENQIARDYLIRWGVTPDHVIGEGQSRDTFESAVAVGKLLRERGWKRYLLVTSAVHMPRSMLVFRAKAPEPVPAPGDFSLGKQPLTPLDFFPTEGAARNIAASLHEYVGLVNYYWRVQYGEGS